jgi:hypothetical protein
VDYVGRGELSVRQQNLGQMLSKLMKLAEEFNVAVLYTNQVMSNPDGGMSFVSDPKKPVGGHVLAHASTTRLELKKVFCCLLPLPLSCSRRCSRPLQQEETPLHAYSNQLTPRDFVPYRSAGTWRPENMQGDAHLTCFRMLGLCSACIPGCCD